MAHCWLYQNRCAFTITNRKHHCRLCGRIVCGNARCSKMIPLFLNMSSGICFWIIHGLCKANDDFKRDLIKNQLEIPEHVVNASDSSLGKNNPFNIVYAVDSHDKKDESLDTKKPWILHPLYSYIINSSSHGRISRSSYPSFMISLYY